MQALGLQEALKNVGVESVEILDFPDDAGTSTSKKFIGTLKEQVNAYGVIRGFIRSLKEVLFVIRTRIDGKRDHSKEQQARIAYFEQFEKQYLCLSKPMACSDLRSLEFVKGLPYDCYITGSDQIWNEKYTGSTDIFFLKYMPSDTIRMSYAGSFGRTFLEDKEKSTFADLIKNIDPILVREEGAKRIADELSGRESFHVPDPTLLHDKSFWAKLAEKPVSFEGGDYILVYSLNHDLSIYREALRLGKQQKKRVVAIKRIFSPPYYSAIKWLYVLGPQHFLWLVEHASMIVTNSFHALVFSLVFNRPCYPYLDRAEQVNERLTSLLHMVGHDHVVTYIGKGHIAPDRKPYDFERINRLIKEFRKDTYERFLRPLPAMECKSV